MRKKNKAPNILEINQGERSSRFVIDLAKETAAEEKKIKKAVKNSWQKRFLYALTEFDFKEFFAKFSNIFRPIKEVTNFRINNLAKEAALDTQLIVSFKTNKQVNKLKSLYKKYENRLEMLAFWGLLKLIIIALGWIGVWFFKVCYSLGWLTLFSLRFIFLLAGSIIGASRDIIKKVSGLVRSNNKVTKTILNEKLPASQGIVQKKWAEAVNKIIKFKKVYFSQNEDYIYQEEVVSEETTPVRPRFAWLKPIGVFALISLVLIMPFKALTYYKTLDLSKIKGEVLGVSEEAISNLMMASDSVGEFNFLKAEENFSQAGSSFLKAQDQLASINEIFFSLAAFAPNKEIKMASQGKNILAAGEMASRLGQSLSLAFASLFDNQEKTLLEIIDDFDYHGGQAAEQAKELSNQLSEINMDALPADYQEKFKKLQTTTDDLTNGLVSFINIVDELKSFLGANKDKRYLLVFQNNTELRATGGFIGSYALVDLSEGIIKNIETPTGGSYDTEGGLRVLVAAPEPLHLVNPLWHFWDANWWPDWPTSAKKLMWFYEKSDGPTVDGVISFTPTVLEKLLAITGPIDMNEDYGVVLTAENFWLETQRIVETKLTPEQVQVGVRAEPKKIIGDLLNNIIAELPRHLNKANLVKILQALESSLREKHILFYFNDTELQAEILERNWGGAMKSTGRDYLAVINTNIAGGKSDLKMKETINQSIEIMPNGAIINTVKIIREHQGIKNEPFAGVRNVDWMRVYVPLGSELLAAQGFRQPDRIYFEEPDLDWDKDPLVYKQEQETKIHEPSNTKIYQENGRTVFANWSMVDPGQSGVIYLKYKLPFNLNTKSKQVNLLEKIKETVNPWQKELYPYSFFVQKQAGAKPSQLQVNLKLPDNFELAWKYPDKLPVSSSGWEINDALDSDKYWAVILTKKN